MPKGERFTGDKVLLMQTVRPEGATRFDPQGHRMGPLGTLAAQATLFVAMLWNFQVVGGLFLPPTLGLLPLLMALGTILLAPKSVLMQLPVSISVLAIIGICTASIAWSIDTGPTSLILRGWIPGVVATAIVAGLLPQREFMQTMLWLVRIAIVVTFMALLAVPETRVHLDPDPNVPPYPGWHGFFPHKNIMTPFLCVGVATVMLFDENPTFKWGTLGLIGVLMVGSTSATGLSAGFLVAIGVAWLRIYQNSQREDLRTSTVFFAASVLGFLAAAIGVVASLATITSAYGKDLTFSGRTFIWEASITAIAERPILGHGVGALFFFEDVSRETDRFWREVGFKNSHAHNGPLDLMLQIGVVGMVIYAVLWFGVLRKAWQSLSDKPELTVWVISILSAQLFIALSENVLLGGFLGLLVAMKVLLIKRESALFAAPVSEMTRWV